MVTLASTTQNTFVRALHKFDLLTEDLDYHVVRAAMVIMFLSSVTRSGFRTSLKGSSRSSATGR